MAKRRYTLSELVSRCDPEAPPPKDMEDWESTAKRDEAFIAQARADIERAERRHMPSGDQTEAERLERIALIENEAEKVFGSAELGKAWMLQKNLALGDTPLAMLDTETGSGEVKKVLASIAYGGAV